MTRKIPIRPDRIRTIPEQFSWLDHRLVRDRHIELVNHEAAALYLFLVTVADCQGLSYYSDSSIGKRLTMDHATLAKARQDLARAGLVAFQRPLYQVLALDAASLRGSTAKTAAGPRALAEIFRQLAGGEP
jgi:hypothetical protein